MRLALTASDGIEIIADHYPLEGAGKFAILLHMMPATKESWEPLAAKLAEAGYESIAIDERGHGESTMGGTLDYKSFSDVEQQAKRLDVEAAFDYLRGRGATEANTVAIGASIGANLALRFLADHPGATHAVALSPGLDYHGVLTDPAVASYGDSQKAMLVASKGDRGSYASIISLREAHPERIKLFEREGLGHGTAMLEREPALMDEIISFLP